MPYTHDGLYQATRSCEPTLINQPSYFFQLFLGRCFQLLLGGRGSPFKSTNPKKGCALFFQWPLGICVFIGACKVMIPHISPRDTPHPLGHHWAKVESAGIPRAGKKPGRCSSPSASGSRRPAPRRSALAGSGKSPPPTLPGWPKKRGQTGYLLRECTLGPPTPRARTGANIRRL